MENPFPLRYLFIDFNAYFASCEQQVEPKLRGKPVAVVPMDADTTSCIAASYEAKKFGIKTGTLVRDAKKMCPGLICVPARHLIYIEYHHKLIEAVESCLPVLKVMSIDEMVCELTGSQQQREKAIALANQIKQTISRNVGECLRCSIGIAPNIFLSKTGSDLQKPNGLVIIEPKDLPQCLIKMELRDIYGVGARMEQRLRASGINTVLELWNASKEKLHKVWGGIEGERLYDNLRCEVVYSPPTHKSTVGHSHVLAPDYRTEEKAYATLHRLLQKAALRLRKYELLASAMYVKIKYLNGARWVDEISFTETQDTVPFIKALTKMWERKKPVYATPIKVAITLFKLKEEKNKTPQLFPFGRSSEALNAALDKLNSIYKKNTVYFGGAHEALDSAPMRIAFTHIPDPEVEGDE
ncbi:MAG: DNA polymerase [Ignavibacteriae bacterium]|nr:DNA polymerase [Ignavibacteriota bacterium]